MVCGLWFGLWFGVEIWGSGCTLLRSAFGKMLLRVGSLFQRKFFSRRGLGFGVWDLGFGEVRFWGLGFSVQVVRY